MPHTRRSSDEVLSAIRDAVHSELAAHGYQGITFEGVARAAGTSRPVLYRRFPTRAAMVTDTVIAHSTEAASTPPTGALRTDLIDLLEVLYAQIGATGVEVFSGLLAEVDHDTATRVEEATLGFFIGRLSTIVDAARAHGELGPERLHPRVPGAVLALARHEATLSPEAPSREDAASLVDHVIVPLLQVSTQAR
ncbi:TetR/AcrR family transcriptional regulator [Demequina pelophila]|uniref:TetR/AcrR family transcriptional regulator n=1 Tax=Demequina pelophila TaxID=1638984 RepID=UPI000782CBA3|nr:TetR/AcrR family transcriptional regulator [Demequina pelophila]